MESRCLPPSIQPFLANISNCRGTSRILFVSSIFYILLKNKKAIKAPSDSIKIKIITAGIISVKNAFQLENWCASATTATDTTNDQIPSANESSITTKKIAIPVPEKANSVFKRVSGDTTNQIK